MTIFNLGSVNADVFYRLPHLVAPGETLAASSVYEGLGGKGANMSVAVARAGAKVHHIGAVGPDGRWAVDRLSGYGVDTAHLVQVDEKTGHAIIMVDDAGENAILLYPGANQAIPAETVSNALAGAGAGDLALMQNETCHQVAFAQAAKRAGLRVAYAAAPFEAAAVQAVLGDLDILVLNQVEADQLKKATGLGPDRLSVKDVVVTLGAEGCDWYDNARGQRHHFDAPKVTPVDTTGAGDTFTGYLLAGLDQGMDMASAIAQAQKAGAIMVTRQGTADVIPTLADVQAWSGT